MSEAHSRAMAGRALVVIALVLTAWALCWLVLTTRQLDTQERLIKAIGAHTAQKSEVDGTAPKGR